MKEHPILFSAPMVRAILEGRKTQTRRVVKHAIPREIKAIDPYLTRQGNEAFGWVIGHSEKYGRIMELAGTKCPYGQPGDRLWVREAFRLSLAGGFYVYRADNGVEDRTAALAKNDPSIRWRPPIHMPRCASRITLEIVSVRVERLNDINEDDAMAEGVEPLLVPPDGGSWPHFEGFRELWESINGAGSWEANPWVWVIEFRRVAQEGKV